MTTDGEKHTTEINKNEYYIKYIYYILDKNIIFKDRQTTAFYMSKGVYDDWKMFCDSNPLMKKSELTEKALISFMAMCPQKDTLINIQIKVDEEKTVQVEIKDKLLCHKLKVWHDRVLEANQRGSAGTSNGSYVKLLERLEEAADFNNPSPRLVAMMEQCKVLI